MAASNDSMTQAELSNRLEILYDSYDLPDTPGGFAVVVIRDGQPIFKKAYGFSNYEHKIPLTTSTVVDYASVAKQFTGFAVAVLIQEGRLRLDDDVSQYLPELPTFGEKITIRHLLHHTSGIRDWVGLVKIAGRHESDVISDDFLMKLFIHQKDLNFKPGEHFQYSNFGYFLLANIVARVTGQTFSAWTREHIFKPLGMVNTHFCEDYREIILNRAGSYKQDKNGQYVNTANQLVAYGSSSLYSTLDDMIKWLANFETHALGGEDVWDMMCRSGSLNSGEKTNYGFGISMDKAQGLESIGHGGSWAGNLCQLSYYPKQNVSYLLSITRDPAGFFAGSKFMDMLLGKEEVAKPELDGNLEPVEMSFAAEQLEEYTGAYLASGKVIWVEQGGSNLNILFPSGQTICVYPVGEDLFFNKESNVKFSFNRNEDGAIGGFVYSVGDNASKPYTKQNENISGLDQYCGDYSCPELLTSYKIVFKDRYLALTHLHNEDVFLQQTAPDTFCGNKWWCTQISMDRDSEGQIVGFRLNCDQNNIQNLRFIKKEM